MLWFFDRADQTLRLETRYDNDTREFVAVIRWPDGREQIERFTEIRDFRRWLVALDHILEFAQWKPTSPVILPYGWPNKR